MNTMALLCTCSCYIMKDILQTVNTSLLPSLQVVRWNKTSCLALDEILQTSKMTCIVVCIILTKCYTYIVHR